MSTKVLSFTLLLLCLCFQDSAQNRRHPGKKLPCCMVTYSKDISSEVTGNKYEQQHSKNQCVEAIIFATPSGTVCVDPKAEWVKKLTAKMTKL
ncbi:chemokine (C-C motif) ligand 34b, duplicate 4 [Sander lucioperca]|uniref:chemokine (C-C motif) ligand 34b, duplicate 4 n=1 Tax=Sander lucioperca TaxID=283035 RepID=UPI001653E4BD|nr:chemokine (C-C motif) ligand 34b, duplicate 4 [Sander lucioperca]